MAQYNAANSLSPMMFKKTTKGDTEGTRSERWRSKSVENIYDTRVAGPGAPQAKKKLRNRAATTDRNGEVTSKSQKVWEEVDKVKAVNPVVACVLPSIAMDFVASALLAVGATPLITEDPDDIPKDLSNCKAALLDISAPQIIVEEFINHFNKVCTGKVPLILVASNCGVSDRKKGLLLQALDELIPTVISGRLGDIYAVSQAVIEKNATPLDSLSDLSGSSDDDISAPIKVVLSHETPEKRGKSDEGKPDITVAAMSPVMKRLYKKSASPPKVPQSNGSHSPRSPVSPSPSPRTSPRSSPVPQVRGIKRLLMKKEKSGTTGLQRVPTALPRVMMKGQFRETQMCDVTVDMALEYAQKLCVYSGSFVHLYETNVVTSGELVVEIFNSQMGVGNLHSTLPCSAGIMAAVLACAELEKEQREDLCVIHCSRGLSLYHVAMEEAGAIASSSEKGVVSPGTLRQTFLDALHYLVEREVRGKALMKTHTQGIASK